MADWQPIEIPHSSATVIGTRVPSWKQFDWFTFNGLLFLAAPFLIAGAIRWEIRHFQHGHLFDNDTMTSTLIGVPVGLIAVAIGIVMVWTPFSGRYFVGPCPGCGERQEWEWPGRDSDITTACSSCKAEVHVGRNGALREADLAETGYFRVWGSDFVGDLRVSEDGHIRPVMPAICAVCGRQPATTAKPDDRGMYRETEQRPMDIVADIVDGAIYDVLSPANAGDGGISRLKVSSHTHDKEPDPAKQRTHDDLAALEIPLCSEHAAETPVSVRDDDYTFKSYRYYRAFLLVNGIPKKARSNESSRAEPPSA
jgi:hypothetical protein